ncbi:MAG: tetratricopeptide repeat protein [Bacteroidetes bacterium]|nr:tetratricopeptide repeat protein [Bacteroidota bacterium]
MEFLKKTLLSLVFLMLATAGGAQDFEKLSKAFESSFAAETKGEYHQAIQALLNVYRPDSYELNLRLGWLHYMSGRFTDALPYYQKSIDLMPVSIEARLGYVLPAAALGNWAQVEKQYRDILKIDPMNTTANYRMGLIHYGRQEYAQALRFFEKVLNLYPFDYDTVIMVAWTHLRSGQLREAKVMFQKALLIRPNDADALQGLSTLK